MKICCISAKAQHGKDTAAKLIKENLEKKGQRVLITHYADLLKFICVKYFGWNEVKDEAGRTLLQYLGTDVVGAQNPAYWAEFIAGLLKMLPNTWDYVLIPDCRYPVEIETMRQIFDTTIVRVERPNFDNGLTEAQKNHPSEVDMDNYPFDYKILNNGTLEELRQEIYNFMGTQI